MLTPLLTLVATIAVLLAVVWLCQRRLIYFPRSQDVPPVASILPGAEEISFDTPDGLRLSGWFAHSTETVAGATVSSSTAMPATADSARRLRPLSIQPASR